MEVLVEAAQELAVRDREEPEILLVPAHHKATTVEVVLVLFLIPVVVVVVHRLQGQTALAVNLEPGEMVQPQQLPVLL
jgi:hypothetical protein